MRRVKVAKVELDEQSGVSKSRVDQGDKVNEESRVDDRDTVRKSSVDEEGTVNQIWAREVSIFSENRVCEVVK